MKAHKRKRNFTGELAKPSLPVIRGLDAELRATLDADQISGWEEYFMEENLKALEEHGRRGFELLFAHYGIDCSDPEAALFTLTMSLARECVPYFRYRTSKPGPKGAEESAVMLEIDIADRRLKGDKSDAAALEFLTHHSTAWSGQEVDTLQRKRRANAGKNAELLRLQKLCKEAVQGERSDIVSLLRRKYMKDISASR